MLTANLNSRSSVASDSYVSANEGGQNYSLVLLQWLIYNENTEAAVLKI